MITLTLLALALLTTPPTPHHRTNPHHTTPHPKHLLPLLALPLLLTTPTLTATAAIIITTTAWAIHNHHTTKQRIKKLTTQSDTITHTLAQLAAGHHPTQALPKNHPHDPHLTTLINIAAHHGIPPQPLLEAHQNTIDAQLHHHTTTHAELQGPKATALTLTLLPLAGIALGQLMGAEPLTYLTHTTTGQLLLLAGTTLTSAGYITTTLIINHATTA